MTHKSTAKTQVTAADLMSDKVFILDPELPVAEAFAQLGDDRVGGAPVVDAAGRVIGVFSIQDVAGNTDHPGAEYAVARLCIGGADSGLDTETSPGFEGSNPGALGSARVEDWMSTDVVSVAPEAGLKELCRAFIEGGVHRVVVVEKGQLVGIVSTLDVVRHFAGS